MDKSQGSETGSSASGVKKSPNANPLIALRSVSRVYDDGAIAALTNLDLEIASGHSVAVVGASGSGKSTLVNLLCGIDHPTTGTVLWRGQPVNSQAQWANLRRNQIGIVFQEFNLIPTLSAIENIELALLGRGISSRRRLARAAVMLDRVGMESRMHSRVTSLSGGERQRVGIARALANEPTLLIADEPTGSLDAANTLLIADLMFKLCDDLGMTIVVVTHDEVLASRCVRRIRIKDGTIDAEPDTVTIAPSVACEAELK